jgi:hypothetical protein
MMRSPRRSDILYTAYKRRIGVTRALIEARGGGGSAMALSEAAYGLQSVAVEFQGTKAGARYHHFATLVEALSRLAGWKGAIRSAEIDADRHLRAAKMLAREVAGELKTPPGTDRLHDAASRVLLISDFDEITSVAAAMLSIPLPLPLFSSKENSRFPTQSPIADNTSVSVAFASFDLDGVQFEDPHTIEPEVLHDLKVEVNVSRWPEGAAELMLEPLSVEPAGAYELPTFTFLGPGEGPDPLLSATGRLLIRNPVSLFARPLEFKYRARFVPNPSHTSVFIQGQRCLHVQCFDPIRSPQSGYAQIDQKLVAVRSQARNLPAIRDSELHDFLVLMAAVGAIAGQALQDNLFPTMSSEADFQKEARRMLRLNRHIGAELEEHPHAAGGITDLSFRGIRLELKVEPHLQATIDNAQRYYEQTIQYVVGSDRRFGILCILDCSEKTAAPGSAANDVFLHIADPPRGGLPIVVGVVIVRGNLCKPSSFSR